MQTKKQSFKEAVTNTAIGFAISYASTFLIFPLVGFESSGGTNLIVTIYFTIISITRSYVVRRWFNNKKPVTSPNNKPFFLHCFECEIEMPVKEKDGVLHCDNCGLIHVSRNTPQKTLCSHNWVNSGSVYDYEYCTLCWDTRHITK